MNISKKGLLDSVVYTPSPNCDERPPGTNISLIVIHGISLPPGKFGGHWISDLFLNQLDSTADPYFAEVCDLKVSSHLLVRRDGEVIQYVPFGKRAWHAGESCFQDQGQCNDYSIGIELEGVDDQAYEPVQYEQLVKLVAGLMSCYPGITGDRITGHKNIAPGRKTDPGEAFDWVLFRKLLASLQEVDDT
ncbi:MAG: 1,6-anhydro-N-acetylmuramyl-L-alanine amidase AmpD [Gammaproteobacteria bacterium]|nr:1,6-anhydro-N-acetylmuramyl-L-alanine amidase AmpD [Gammaproteobacteria bacterium]